MHTMPMAELSYNIRDQKNAKAFCVYKEEEHVATFYYHDEDVPKDVIERCAAIFCNQMNDLTTQKQKHENHIG